MSETVVRVDLRQATLSENARLREIGDRLFLALENPPPVRCLLRLNAGGEQKAFEVTRVIEVVDETEPARGCYGRHVELERLSEQARVGSEHLEPGIRSGGGVPSPVVIMNSGEMLLGEASEESEGIAIARRDAGEVTEAPSSEAGGEGEASSDAGESEPSASE